MFVVSEIQLVGRISFGNHSRGKDAGQSLQGRLWRTLQQGLHDARKRPKGLRVNKRQKVPKTAVEAEPPNAVQIVAFTPFVLTWPAAVP